jgi:predicted nucleic acid-binding protein
VILDTNALSAFVDGHPGVGAALRLANRAALPVVVLGEFRYGIAESRHRAAYEAWLAENLPHFEILDVTDETAVAYAALRATLRQLGRPIPGNDVWIAALALQHRLPVLTRDLHFDAVPGLERKGWEGL